MSKPDSMWDSAAIAGMCFFFAFVIVVCAAIAQVI